jgi:hypothetical protein
MVGSCANRSLPLSGRVELDHARLGSPIKPAVSNEYGRLAGPGWGIGVLVDVRFGASSRTSGHVRIVPILLQKSKVASVRISGETLKREAIDDSDNLSRVTEVAYEFGVRR